MELSSLYRSWIGHLSILILLLPLYLLYLPMKTALRRWSAPESATTTPWNVVLNYLETSRNMNGRVGYWFWAFSAIFALENINMVLYAYFNMKEATFLDLEKVDYSAILTAFFIVVFVYGINAMQRRIKTDGDKPTRKLFSEYRNATKEEDGCIGIWFWLTIGAIIAAFMAAALPLLISIFN